MAVGPSQDVAEGRNRRGDWILTVISSPSPFSWAHRRAGSSPSTHAVHVAGASEWGRQAPRASTKSPRGWTGLPVRPVNRATRN